MSGFEALLAGRTLSDRYLVEALVGRGGMGAVYRATDGRLGREVAVKVISPAGNVEPESRETLRARFAREARAAARLHHPNVVQVYDFGTDAALDLDFLVMELLRGEDLAQRLARGWRPSVGDAVAILRGAARGLAAGHRMGLVHRDVKPGNLFLCQEEDGGEEVRVLDFGIAQVTYEDGTVTHFTRWGGPPLSPAYASPEQLAGETTLRPASDVYGLGAVAYQLLSGRRPLADADVRRLAAGTPVEPPAPLEAGDELPAGLAALVARALRFDPAGRPADAAAFLDELDGALGLPARAPGRRERDAAATPSIAAGSLVGRAGDEARPGAPAAGSAPSDDQTELAPADAGARPAVAPPALPVVPAARAASAAGDRCADCGRAIAADTRYCPGCGEAVEGRVTRASLERRRGAAATGRPAIPPPRRPRSRVPLLAAGLVLAAGVGALGAAAFATPEALGLAAWRAPAPDPGPPPVRDLPEILVQRQERVREPKWSASPVLADGRCGSFFDTCVRVQCSVTNTGDAPGRARVTAVLRGETEHQHDEVVSLDPGEARILNFEFREARHGERFDEAICDAETVAPGDVPLPQLPDMDPGQATDDG